jgi:hypothetical protein
MIQKEDLQVTDTKPGAPGDPVPVALALLGRWWPDVRALADEPRADELADLERNPRYVIGRLQQAITTLLAGDVPPMDSQTALLSQAIGDAIAWRLHDGRPCPDCVDELCGPCNADWTQADRYHALARALGAMGDRPPVRGTAAARSPVSSR